MANCGNLAFADGGLIKTMPIEYSIVPGYFYKNGKRVGAKHGKGYTVIWWENKCWLAHRLAYHLLGVPLPSQIDHMNGVRSCSAWHNLRDSPATYNQEARHAVVSASGFVGVSFRRDTGRWQAYIKSKGKKMNLGCYDTAEEASVAYQAAKARLHTHAPGWRYDKTEPDA